MGIGLIESDSEGVLVCMPYWSIVLPLTLLSAYLLLMSGKTTEIIGAGLASFAVPLIAFAMTRSVVAAGLVATVGELGNLIATLPAGVIAGLTPCTWAFTIDQVPTGTIFVVQLNYVSNSNPTTVKSLQTPGYFACGGT